MPLRYQIVTRVRVKTCALIAPLPGQTQPLILCKLAKRVQWIVKRRGKKKRFITQYDQSGERDREI